MKMKGLEFTAVYIPHLQDSFESINLKDEAEIAEKRRQFFTAMTRARRTLVLSYFDEFPSQFSPIEGYVEYKDLGGFKRKI